jgi:hypothetical protein
MHVSKPISLNLANFQSFRGGENGNLAGNILQDFRANSKPGCRMGEYESKKEEL